MIKFYIQTNNSKNYLRCWFNFDGHSITTLRSNLSVCNEFDHSLTSSKALPSSDNDGQYQLHTFFVLQNLLMQNWMFMNRDQEFNLFCLF